MEDDQKKFDYFIEEHFDPTYISSSLEDDQSQHIHTYAGNNDFNVDSILHQSVEPTIPEPYGPDYATCADQVITAHDFDILDNLSFEATAEYNEDFTDPNFHNLPASITTQDYATIPTYGTNDNATDGAFVFDSILADSDNFRRSLSDLGKTQEGAVTSAGGFERWRRARQSLPRRRSHYSLQKDAYSNVATFTTGQSDPLQRWQNSPPENEPASMSAINQALTSIQLKKSASNPEIASAIHPRESPVASRRRRRPRSLARSTGSRGSSSSRQSETSNQSSRSASVQRPRNSGSRTARDTSQAIRKTKNDQPCKFKCTFCCDQFQRKYDWARHEKSLHLDMEEWKCTPFGGTVILPSANRVVCAYCNILDPNDEHLDTHNHCACHAVGVVPKTFRRKDHLAQHLRLVHRLSTLPVIDHWKVEPPPLRSRCGMCNFKMHTWEERQEHLAAHFRKGQTMDDWHGGHDFDPHVEARLRNSMPPYLIGNESRTFIPISATNMAYRDHHQQILSHLQTENNFDQDVSERPLDPQGQTSAPMQTPDYQTTFTMLLTSHLARYAQELAKKGIVPTDQMFQEESRKMVYHYNDPWDQTVADNAEWLAEFRQRNNLSFQTD